DSEGKPVAGARVRVANVQAGGDPKETLEALRDRYHKEPGGGQAPPKPKEWKDWSGSVPGQAPVVTTGEDGRFRLAGFGGERLVIFQVEGPGIATDYFRVMTQVGDPVVRPEFEGKIPGWMVVQNGIPLETVTAPSETVCYGATFRYLAAASRPIRGVVSDKKTGKPLAGVEVSAFGTKEDGLPRFLSVPEGAVSARTDREGRYELRGCLKSPGYVCFARAAKDRGHYFRMQFKVEGTAGLEPGVGRPAEGWSREPHRAFCIAQKARSCTVGGFRGVTSLGTAGRRRVLLPGPRKLASRCSATAKARW